MLHLSYLGHGYHGWQTQPGVKSIQSTLESVVSEILKERINVVGCGRTDTGVNANQYFAHFDTNQLIEDTFLHRLNRRLPSTIAIHDVIPVHDVAHARYDAISRGYTYYLHTKKCPILDQRSAYYPGMNLNLTALSEAIDWIADTKDFFAFCRRPTKLNTTVCHIFKIQLSTNFQQSHLKFEIYADRFITGMIRLLMSKLLEYNIGQINESEFKALLSRESKMVRLNQAYPQGLYLTHVDIPYIRVTKRDIPFDIDNQFAPLVIKIIDNQFFS